MQGKDNALQGGVNMGLASFATVNLALPLLLNEERYEVPIESLGLVVVIGCEGAVNRSCIMNRDSGDTRFEVDWSAPRNVLHDYGDMGCIGFVNKFYLYTRKHLRGWWWIDPPHRRHDNVISAMEKAG